ncbi:HesA/MoeB/ThiF family protein [Vibrio renipiscarius]|uniref:Molybdopterin-synthase adenylyltransferase n=1 Tax=Vibrio renipiscarius TaxID=1461322 RepID=A0A0C2JWT8_9VIBR|nr:HesA/MoeB/ThiF family protein [Vibrio renipiscarius]KII78642.1 molybdopterin-synthase adenylyltransferase [Vibrio renipiscarius]KII82409.1 molybdopterin-synthase adenylyltransferase [Vibrio renipiscarius]
MLPDSLFERYQRQIGLLEIGERGQESLIASHILVIGCGGLGSAATLYLAAAGVGRLVLVDDDVLEESNLQRQVAYRQTDLGKSKVAALTVQLQDLNSNVAVRTLNQRLSDEQLGLEIMLADLVLDCSDNLTTRQQVNRLCYQQNRPLVSAAAIGWQGQFSVFDYKDEAPCYRCLIPFDEMPQKSKCNDMGVVGPVVGTLGNYQALAAIQKLATGQFLVKPNHLHLFNGQSMEWQTIEIVHDRECHVCANLREATL